MKKALNTCKLIWAEIIPLRIVLWHDHRYLQSFTM